MRCKQFFLNIYCVFSLSEQSRIHILHCLLRQLSSAFIIEKLASQAKIWIAFPRKTTSCIPELLLQDISRSKNISSCITIEKRPCYSVPRTEVLSKVDISTRLVSSLDLNADYLKSTTLTVRIWYRYSPNFDVLTKGRSDKHVLWNQHEWIGIYIHKWEGSGTLINLYGYKKKDNTNALASRERTLEQKTKLYFNEN